MRTLIIAALLLGAAPTDAVLAGGFVELGLSSSNASVSCGDTYSCKNSSTGYKISGGYAINPLMNIEAIYYDLGKISASFTTSSPNDSRMRIKTSGIGVGGLTIVPLQDQWSIMIRLGLLNAISKSDINLPGVDSVSDPKSSWSIYYGVGGGFDVMKDLTVNVEFERFNASNSYIGSYTSSTLSVAGRYKF